MMHLVGFVLAALAASRGFAAPVDTPTAPSVAGVAGVILPAGHASAAALAARQIEVSSVTAPVSGTSVQALVDNVQTSSAAAVVSARPVSTVTSLPVSAVTPSSVPVSTGVVSSLPVGAAVASSVPVDTTVPNVTSVPVAARQVPTNVPSAPVDTSSVAPAPAIESEPTTGDIQVRYEAPTDAAGQTTVVSVTSQAVVASSATSSVVQKVPAVPCEAASASAKVDEVTSSIPSASTKVEVPTVTATTVVSTAATAPTSVTTLV